MANQSYVFINGGINVDIIKIDSDINKTYEEALAEKEKMLSTTILHTTYDTSVNAKYFSPEGQTAGANYSVYRKTPYQNYYDFLCQMENGEYVFYDYNINNHNFYHYLCSVEIETGGTPEYLIYQNRNDKGELTYARTNWEQWSICDIEDTTEDNVYFKTGPVWRFWVNITEESLNQNNSVTIWDTLGKYPKISIGQKDYSGSTFTALLGDMCDFNKYNFNTDSDKTVYNYTERIHLKDKYSREIEKLNAWKEFCNNGKLKLFKDVKGNSWIIQITDSITQSIDPTSNISQTTISFNWVEVEDISKSAIVNLGETVEKLDEKS